MYQKGLPVSVIAEKTRLHENTINRNMRALELNRGRGWTKGRKKQEPNGMQIHRETAGEPEPVPLFTVKQEVRKAKRITVRGKAYLDVSDWYL